MLLADPRQPRITEEVSQWQPEALRQVPESKGDQAVLQLDQPLVSIHSAISCIAGFELAF